MPMFKRINDEKKPLLITRSEREVETMTSNHTSRWSHEHDAVVRATSSLE